MKRIAASRGAHANRGREGIEGGFEPDGPPASASMRSVASGKATAPVFNMQSTLFNRLVWIGVGMAGLLFPAFAYLKPDTFTGLDALLGESDAIAIVSPLSSDHAIDDNGMTLYSCRLDAVLKGPLKPRATMRLALFEAGALAHYFPCLVFLRKDSLYKNELEPDPIEYRSPIARGAVIPLFPDADADRLKGATPREKIVLLLQQRKAYLDRKYKEQVEFLDLSIKSLSGPAAPEAPEKR